MRVVLPLVLMLLVDYASADVRFYSISSLLSLTSRVEDKLFCERSLLFQTFVYLTPRLSLVDRQDLEDKPYVR